MFKVSKPTKPTKPASSKPIRQPPKITQPLIKVAPQAQPKKGCDCDEKLPKWFR